jgi:hypothetical protein
MTDQPKRRRKKPGSSGLPKYVLAELYPLQHFLSGETCKRLDLSLTVPIFIKDPLVARQQPKVGVQNITVRLEADLSNGPTSARIAVV